MPKVSKARLIEDFADAAVQFIVKNPPEGFNVPFFSILVMSGRIDEATDYLGKFPKEVEA